MKTLSRRSAGGCLLALGLAACSVGPGAGSAGPDGTPPAPLEVPDLEITEPPYTSVHANWKQRLDQPYVFVDALGSYTRIGDALGRADALCREQDLEPCGPPFALFYDDPGAVAAEALRARACFPVNGAVTPSGDLRYDVLESTTVVYAFVAGPYPEVPRSYPGLFEYMRKLSWMENGPIRESYLVDPSRVTDWNQLVTEVQIPATSR